MNKQQLASLIWDTCNDLRGSISAVEYKDIILGFIFYRFVSENEAMNYYHHLKQEDSPLRLYSDKDHIEFAVSTQNYATFYNRKDPSAYAPFFDKYYLKRNNKQ